MFTSMKPRMLFVTVTTTLQESSVKVSLLYIVKPLVCSHSLPTIGTHENSSTYHTKAEIVASLCFSENICGNAAIQPVLISKRIVGGVEAVPNAWPWHISQQNFGESLNPNYNAILLLFN